MTTRSTQHAARSTQQATRQRFGEAYGTSDCWDNAVADSFFATLKGELLDDGCWKTRDDARGAIFEYIEAYYNVTRRHSALGNISPVAFERLGQQEGVAS